MPGQSHLELKVPARSGAPPGQVWVSRQSPETGAPAPREEKQRPKGIREGINAQQPHTAHFGAFPMTFCSSKPSADALTCCLCPFAVVCSFSLPVLGGRCTWAHLPTSEKQLKPIKLGTQFVSFLFKLLIDSVLCLRSPGI